MLTAITMHYNPGVTAAAGHVPYLLAAGTLVDVVGCSSWELPRATITNAIAHHPRAGFKRVFADGFRQDAARPSGARSVPAPLRRVRRCREALPVRGVSSRPEPAHQVDRDRTDPAHILDAQDLTEPLGARHDHHNLTRNHAYGRA